MANVIYVDGDSAALSFNTLLYQDQHPNNNNYFYSQVTNFSNTLSDLGRSFMEGSKIIYDKINSSESDNIAKAALRAAAGMFNRVIRPLQELSEFQSAAPLMQRYLMSSPSVLQLYRDQQCDGFSETFVDMFPNDIGETHYDYRRVMTGVVVDTEEGSFATHYIDELLEGDKELTHREQFDIQSTWEIMEMYLKAMKEDPTSPFGGML